MYPSEVTYASVAYHSFQIRLLRASEAHSYSHVILAVNFKHLLKQPAIGISHKHKLHKTNGGEVPCFLILSISSFSCAPVPEHHTEAAPA